MKQRPLRIAFVVPCFPHLPYTFIVNQITGLIDLGHEVDIYAFGQEPNQGIIQNDVTKYNLLNQTHYLTGPNKRLNKIIGGIKLIFTQFYKNPLAILTSLIESDGFPTALNNLFIIVPFLNNAYDIIHCHVGNIGNRLIFLKKLLNVPFVVTFHGADIKFGEENRDIYKALFAKADLIMAISDSYNRRKLIEFGCPENKIVTHHVGVDLDKFKFRPYRNVNNSKTIKIVTVARLHETKGYPYAIQAVSKVLRDNIKLNLEYTIVGGGELKNQLEALITRLGLSSHIHLLGPMDNEHVAEMLYASDIFILPSLAEATPTVLMEAQAIGLPIVATKVGATSEVVADRKSGFLVPERNADALAEKLTYLIEHREIWPEFGRFGRKHVEENYNIRVLNERLLQIYQKLRSLST